MFISPMPPFPWGLGLGRLPGLLRRDCCGHEGQRVLAPLSPALTCQSPWQRALLAWRAATRPCPGKRVWQKRVFFQGEGICRTDLGTAGWPINNLAALQNVGERPQDLGKQDL